MIKNSFTLVSSTEKCRLIDLCEQQKTVVDIGKPASFRAANEKQGTKAGN